MTTLTVLHVLSGDPLPHKSDAVRCRSSIRGTLRRLPPRRGTDGPDDAPATPKPCCEAKRGDRQALMTGGSVAVRAAARRPAAVRRPTRATPRPTSSRCSTCRSCYGSGWSAAEDEAHARVAVIAKALNEKLFGGGNSVGKTAAPGRQPTSASSACSTTGGRCRSSTTSSAAAMATARPSRCSCRSPRRAT